MPNWTKEQLDAIEKDGTNILVSAGAGSGKTAVLTERVIQKLKKGCSIKQLLILTFTNAAAAEMKERIRDKMKQEDSLQSQLQDLDSAFITTFDSYALSLVKKYHYLLNLPSNPVISDGTFLSLSKKQILDEIFEELYEEEHPKFLTMVSELCTKNDQDIKKEILAMDLKLSLLSNKKEFLNTYLEQAFTPSKIEEDIQNYVSFLKEKIRFFEELLSEFDRYDQNEYGLKVREIFASLFDSNTYEEIKLASSISLPMLPRGTSDEVKALKEQLSSFLKEIQTHTMYENTEEIKETILKSKDYVEVVILILKRFHERFLAFKREKNLFEFNDIALLALKIIRNYPNVLEEIKSNFQEILVDEYQDTNDLQEEFLSLIGSNNIYMVGDIKQSIYRFRNANPLIFKEKYERYQKMEDGIKINLNKNFRSRKEVLTNINLMFQELMTSQIGGAEYKDSHQMIFGNLMYEKEETLGNDMEIYEYPYEKGEYSQKEIEAFFVAKDILKKIKMGYPVLDKKTNLLRPIRYSDITILMDRGEAFSLYKKIFEYHHIPLSLYQTEQLQGDDITVLKNIYLLAIQIKQNNFDEFFWHLFMSVGRSFLCTYKDQELFKLFVEKDCFHTELYQKVKKISEIFDFSSPRKILETILEEFDFYQKCITLGNVDAAMMRLDFILSMSSDLGNIGYSPYQFGEYFDKVMKEEKVEFSASLDQVDSVKIMNIHKSKGLEFPICYFTGLYKEFNMQECREKFLFDSAYGFIAPYFKEGIGSTIYKDLYKEKYKLEEISEKVRLFYVAVTRAKEKMIFVCPKMKNSFCSLESSKRKFRSFLDFFSYDSELLEDYYRLICLDDIFLTKDYLIGKNFKFDSTSKVDNKIEVSEISIDNSNIVEKSFSKKVKELLSEEERKNIEIGLEFHSILEVLDLQNPDTSFIKNDFIKKKVDHFLESLSSKKIEEATIYQEQEFYYESDSLYHGIIDLMLEFQDHIEIIDYKFRNIDDLHYQDQLQGYRMYIEKMTGKKVKIFLYSILLEKWKEL